MCSYLQGLHNLKGLRLRRATRQICQKDKPGPALVQRSYEAGFIRGQVTDAIEVVKIEDLPLGTLKFHRLSEKTLGPERIFFGNFNIHPKL